MTRSKRRTAIFSILVIIVVGTVGIFTCLDLDMSFLFGNDDKYHAAESMKQHNDSLEHTKHYKEIMPEVMKEVYRTYAKKEIEDAEEHLNRMGGGNVSDSTDMEYTHYEREKINNAKSLLENEPEKAAELYFRMGTCKDLWYIQKSILKDKYGIIWYTPEELNPNTTYD